MSKLAKGFGDGWGWIGWATVRDEREAVWNFSDEDGWGWIDWATVWWDIRKRLCEASAMEMGEGELVELQCDGRWERGHMKFQRWRWVRGLVKLQRWRMVCDGLSLKRGESRWRNKEMKREENINNERDERKISGEKGIINFFFLFYNTATMQLYL